MKSSLLIAPLLLLILTAALRADTIVLRDGKELTGVNVESEDFTKVAYRRGSAAQTVPSADVRSITYSRTSPEYVSGMASLDAGENLAAAEQLVTAADNEKLGEHIRAAALIEACDALLANNNFKDAIVYYDQLLTEHPNTRHLGRALHGRGRALFFDGRVDEALTAFGKLKSEAEAKALGQRWALEAEFYTIWANEARDPSKDYVPQYQALRTKAAAVDSGLANRCALNMGRASLRKQDLARAESMFQEIIDKRLDSEDDVVAGAFNGRGEVSFARAIAATKSPDTLERALDEFREARLDFLRVYVSYKGVAREQPKALFMAGQSFLNIGTLDKEEGEAQYHGRVLLSRLRADFPNSSEAKQAAGI